MFSSKDLFFTPASTTGYRVSNSLRFRSSASAYLNRTPGSAGSLTTWTWSAWVKRGAISSSTTYVMLSGGAGATSTTNWVGFVNDTLAFSVADGTYYLVSTAVYRDPSAWYHIVAVYDSSNATSSNRMKLYVNGVQITAFSTATYPTSSYAGYINGANGNFLGVRASYSDRYFDGYLAEVNFIDGQALTPSSFGAYDATTGVWQPKAYTGTYGTNGFYLKFADNSAATAAAIGKDSSGNGNNWTPNNISLTAGVTYDSMIDSPTNYADGGNGRGNYAVLNAVDKGTTITVQAANLQTTIGATHNGVRGTIQLPTSGKWYWEVTPSTTTSGSVIGSFGVATSAASMNTYDYNTTGTYSLYMSGTLQLIPNGGLGTSWGGATTGGTVCGVAYDADNGQLYLAVANTYYNSAGSGTGNPAGGTNSSMAAAASLGLFPYVHAYSETIDINFGQRPFIYTPPSGFKALNTQNLPTPTIANGAQYMAAVLYTGSGSSQTITASSTNSGNNPLGVTFQPDFVWVKGRSGATDHAWYDVVRGVQKQLESNTTTAETTETTGLTAFTSSGFTTGALAQMNTNTATYVAWEWIAGGTGVTNTSGSITSTVSASVASGFSVVTYTGTGANATVGHGLGVAPSMIIAKRRNTTESWQIYHLSMPSAAYCIQLNTTNAQTSAPTVWNSNSPTSSVFSVGTDTSTNASTSTYVAYCFAAVSGYSAFGSYTGNGSADGPFVYTGFRPRFVLVKTSTVASQPWYIFDTSRQTYNSATNPELYPNTSSAEVNSFLEIDILSNGFKVKSTGTGMNSSGGTYIYAAFCENPFKYSLAR